MKILNKIKNWGLWIIGIVGSIFVFIKLFGKTKENHNTDRLKGQNDILDSNIKSNDIEVDILNENIESLKEEISETQREKNTEELDEFFDKRGF